jgi:hypothetical protein
MEIGPANDRMVGKWLGFGRSPGEINDGPWLFTRVSTDYDRTTGQKREVTRLMTLCNGKILQSYSSTIFDYFTYGHRNVP